MTEATSDGRSEHVLSDLSQEAALGVEVVLTLGAIMLSSGSSTNDVEQAMRSTATAIDLPRATAVVSFNTVSLTYFPEPQAQPITAIRLAPQRLNEYRRLSAAATLAGNLRSGAIDLSQAALELDRISGSDMSDMTWSRPLAGLAQAASAAAFTIVFGGTVVDALVTLLISTLVQPAVMSLDRSKLPPFFRSLLSPFLVALLVAGAVAAGASINPPLVLAGSMLQFLPGAALVAGMRDLIDQSIVSGSARLAEALLVGGAVASGTALGIGLANQFGIALDVGITIGESWQIPIQVAAAAVACGTWAGHLGQRHLALLTASLLGAAGWFAYATAAQFGSSTLTATALAGLVIGAGGQLVARNSENQTVLRVVPASYPLLPGLLIVNGMLSQDAVEG